MYDAFLLVSFGGPEGMDEVMPFLENVVRGQNVPRQRLEEVVRHYELFDGVSPLNAQNRALLAALADEFNAHDVRLPIYWGNRHWHPMLEEAVEQMAADGVRRALAFVTSPFGSPPSCRRYLDDIERARRSVGPNAPEIDKLRLFYNHPGFIESMRDRVIAAMKQATPKELAAARLLFTAHSIPIHMAEHSPYERQLREACKLVAQSVAASQNIGVDNFAASWRLAYQSRSGPPSQPWLEPSLSDAIRQLHADGASDIILAPIGFLAENIEVLYDLDHEATAICDELGVGMIRAGVVGCHPRFVQMIRELVVERLDPNAPRLSLGEAGVWPDRCPADCCNLPPSL